MSHNVLKHFMLKHPAEFPLFLASYCEFIPKEEITLSNATRHVALLLRSAVEVNQRPLVESLSRILVRHLSVFRDAGHPFFVAQTESAMQISTAQGRLARHPLLEDLVRETRVMMEPPAAENPQAKVVAIARRKPRETPIKFAKIGEKPSPLEQMLQLAC
jgi:hypothetical protein